MFYRHHTTHCQNLSQYAITYSMKKLEGFTLVELLIVMAIISVISAVGWVAMQYGLRVARDTQRIQALRAVEQANLAYYNDHGTYLYMVRGWSHKCLAGYRFFYQKHPQAWLWYFNYHYWSTCLGNTVGEYTDPAVGEFINNAENYTFIYALPYTERTYGYYACTLLETSKYDPNHGYFKAISAYPWTPQQYRKYHSCFCIGPSVQTVFNYLGYLEFVYLRCVR